MDALANSTAIACLHSISRGACYVVSRSPSLLGPQRCRIPHINGFREAAVLQHRPRQRRRLERMKCSCRSAIIVNTKPAINSKQSKSKSRGGPLWMLSLNNWVVQDYYKLVEAVNSLEPLIWSLLDEKLRAKTDEF